LLHVIDAASPLRDEQQAEVERVLEEIGADTVTQILVYNKCDLLEDSRQAREQADWIEAHPGVMRQRVFVSARTGLGLDRLRQAIADAALLRLNAAGATPHPLLPDGTPVASPTHWHS
jgi:GTPase